MHTRYMYITLDVECHGYYILFLFFDRCRKLFSELKKRKTEYDEMMEKLEREVFLNVHVHVQCPECVGIHMYMCVYVYICILVPLWLL